ncbi:MAG: hypothetical protein LBR53_08225 [Deltaproteobacteria bacterium]|nr:hypothetical protein [Deltaproteobacteria bacterium]
MVETDRKESLARLGGDFWDASDASERLVTVMDVVRAYGFIMNSRYDFGLYEECLELADVRVSTTPELRKSRADTIILIAKEYLTRKQVEKPRMT